MASFVERISVIIDTKADQAVSGIKSFRSAVSEANGISGKFKAGWKQATSAAGQNIGMFAATAAASLVAFGIKAVRAFEDTAKAAVDLGKATGLSTEQASRWIAVADDYEVSAGDLQAALVKMGKSLDGAAFDQYGIATKNAAGETRTANAIFLDVLETINNTAPMDRAKVGTDLLGKGFAGLAPMLGKSRKEYEKMLAEVEAGQVITASEAKKAERMRLAQDKLADALKDTTLAVGEQVAALAPYIEALADVVTLTAQINPELGNMGDQLRSLGQMAADSGDGIAYLVEMGYSVAAAEKIMAEYTAAVERETMAQTAATAATDAAKASSDRLKRAIEGTTDAVEVLTDSYDEFMGTIDDEESYQEAMLGLLDLDKSLADIDASIKDGSMTWEEGARRASVAISGTKKDVANYAREVLGVPPERLTNIFALIDQGKLTEAQRLLDLLTRSRTVELLIQASPKGSGSSGGGNGGSGTYVPGGGKGGGDVGNPSAKGESVRGGMTVNFYGVTNAREIVDLITAAEKDGVRAGWMVQR